MRNWSFEQKQENKVTTITLQLTEHANIFLCTYLVVVFDHLSLQPLLPYTRSQQCFPIATVRTCGHFEKFELPLSHCIYSLRIANYLTIFNQAASNRRSDNNKEKLSASIRSELASDFCRERKFALRWSETKKLKISVPHNIFFLYLIIIKLCILKQLENIHQKLKLEFS